MSRLKLYIFNLLVIGLIYTGCSSSPELIYSWHDPDTVVKFDSLHKVLVIAALKDNYNRKFTENRFASRLGDAGVRSYEYFTLRELKEKKDYFIKKFKEDNFDGAIIVRVVDSNTDIKVVENNPTYYLDYWNAYDFYTNFALNKGSLTREETLKIEVNVYSFKTDKLVWTGLTSLVNPTSDLNKIVNGIADVVGDKMVEENFISK
jgi:hypothetical protein